MVSFSFWVFLQIHVGGSYEDERDGLLVAFLATRTEPLIVLRLGDQVQQTPCL